MRLTRLAEYRLIIAVALLWSFLPALTEGAGSSSRWSIGGIFKSLYSRSKEQGVAVSAGLNQKLLDADSETCQAAEVRGPEGILLMERTLSRILSEKAVKSDKAFQISGQELRNVFSKLRTFEALYLDAPDSRQLGASLISKEDTKTFGVESQTLRPSTSKGTLVQARQSTSLENKQDIFQEELISDNQQTAWNSLIGALLSFLLHYSQTETLQKRKDIGSVAWGLLNYLIVNQVSKYGITQECILQRQEYQQALRELTIAQCAMDPTIDPFFDIQQVETYFCEQENLKHISGLLRVMSTEDWRALELQYLKKYLSLYQNFQYGPKEVGIKVFFPLRKLLHDLECRATITQEQWISLCDRPLKSVEFNSQTTETKFLYYIYFYKSFRYCQKYLAESMKFDDEMVKKMELFGKIFGTAQATIHYHKVLTDPKIIVKYKCQSGGFKRIHEFQRITIPALDGTPPFKKKAGIAVEYTKELKAGQWTLDVRPTHQEDSHRWYEELEKLALTVNTEYFGLLMIKEKIKEVQQTPDLSEKDKNYLEFYESNLITDLVDISLKEALSVESSERSVRNFQKMQALGKRNLLLIAQGL